MNTYDTSTARARRASLQAGVARINRIAATDCGHVGADLVIGYADGSLWVGGELFGHPLLADALAQRLEKSTPKEHHEPVN